ncbi:MAG: PIN domain-containing protein [Paracoccaceae bacterium]
MIGLDTNILVRFLVQDDPGQGALARDLMAKCTEQDPGFVGCEVLIELVWVLERAYGFPRGKVSEALDALLSAEELILESPDAVALATERYRNEGADFADQMIAGAARRAGCQCLYTFDKRAARHPEVVLLTQG